MFFEPYMPELRYCRDILQAVREGQLRLATPDVRRTAHDRVPHEVPQAASRKQFKSAALDYGLIAAVTAAGIAAGFYSALAIMRRRS